MILRTGSFLQDGRYEILEQIGSGGMSVVYKAKCHKMNRLVAIKVLKEEFANDANFVGKFKMEAQAAAGLSHPNIVIVYDVVDEGDIHYIVMELIEGITLKSYIQKKGRLEVKETIGIAIQVAQGMAAAHEQHIIHRDIKPQNMIISRDGKVKVADFGIARAVSAQTLTSSAMGSVHYISPEQARGGYSDARSDIYSLGITMYEMVTGKLPFDGDNTVAIALAHLEDVVVPPSVYNPEIPSSLEQIILKCTEKKPERRFADVSQTIAALRKVLLRAEDEFAKPEHETIVGDTVGRVIDSETIAITQDELSQIKEGTRPDVFKEPPPRRPEKAQPKARQGRGPRRDDDVNSNLERLFASAGVIAAIIIVAVLIVVVSKLTGLFQFSFSNQEPPTIPTLESTAESIEVSLEDDEILVPTVTSLTEEEANLALKDAGLIVKPQYDYFDDVEQGHVAWQKPGAGTVLQRNDNIVTIMISHGSDKIDLMALELEAMDESTARRAIAGHELEVEVIKEESDTVRAGNVVRVEPTKASKGELVKLYVSTGPHIELVSVPDLSNLSEAEAIARLAEAGLVPGATDTEFNDTVERGNIIRQSGGENGQIEPGGAIGYIVSAGPEQKVQRYVASIHDTYDLSSLIGPGAGSANATLMIRLHQVNSDGTDAYKTLTDTVTITGSVLLPISYTSIESINGSDQGEVQVVEVETGAVLKTYPLAFFPMD